MPDALSATTLPIYPGLGQAPSKLACIPGGLVAYLVVLKITKKYFLTVTTIVTIFFLNLCCGGLSLLLSFLV